MRNAPNLRNIMRKINDLVDKINNASPYKKFHGASILFNFILMMMASGTSFGCVMYGMYKDGIMMFLCALLALTNMFYSFGKIN